jgi:adenine-specific DNA-methyltransferase
MDYTKQSLKELKELCKERKITGYSNKNKSEIIKLVQSHVSSSIKDDISAIACEKSEPSELQDGLSTKTEEVDAEQTIINDNVSYFNIDILEFKTTIKFDLIYLDPPYETNRTFSVNSLDDETGFNDVWEENKYSEWVDKLILHLSSLLTPHGTLVFHISSENSFIAESILRKYFKKIQKVYWKRCHGKNTVKNKLGEMIDVIFACSNNNNIFNMMHTPIDDNSVWAFKNKDETGEYSLGALKHDRTRVGHLYSITNNGITYQNKYGWKQKKEVVEKLIEENRIHFAPKQQNMYVKIYKHEHKGVPLSNLWNDIHSITRTSKDPRVYPTQKPQKLLERIIKIYSNENSYILDPVCGSGTTGFVADKLKRKCILCDINKETLSVVVNRFKDAIYNI